MSDEKKPLKIAWVRLDGLGDLLCTLPSERLAASYSVQLHWLIHSPWDELWAYAPSLNSRTLPISSQASAWEKFKICYSIFKREQFAAVCIFFAPWWLSLAAWLARVPVRVGRKSQWWSYVFLTHGIRQKRSRSERHEAEYNWELADFFFQVLTGGDKILSATNKIELPKNHPPQEPKHPTAMLRTAATKTEPFVKSSPDYQSQISYKPQGEIKSALSRSLHQHSSCADELTLLPSPMTPITFASRQHKPIVLTEGVQARLGSYVVIHPGMKGSAGNWPPTSYSKLIERLVPHFPVVITGTPSDSHWIKPLTEKWEKHPQVSFFIGKPLGDLIHILSHAGAVIVPSTGIAHLSSACGTWTIGLYPDVTAQSPRRWRPLGEKVILLTSSHPELADIDPVTVAEQAVQIMKSP